MKDSKNIYDLTFVFECNSPHAQVYREINGNIVQTDGRLKGKIEGQFLEDHPDYIICRSVKEPQSYSGTLPLVATKYFKATDLKQIEVYDDNNDSFSYAALESSKLALLLEDGRKYKAKVIDFILHKESLAEQAGYKFSRSELSQCGLEDSWGIAKGQLRRARRTAARSLY